VLLLQVERASQRDVAVKMAFVNSSKMRTETRATRIVNHLPEQNTFRYKRIFVWGDVTFSKRIW